MSLMRRNALFPQSEDRKRKFEHSTFNKKQNPKKQKKRSKYNTSFAT